MRIDMYTREDCIFCERLKEFCKSFDVEIVNEYKIGETISREEFFEKMPEGVKTVPQVFFEKSKGEFEYVGGYEEFVAFYQKFCNGK